MSLETPCVMEIDLLGWKRATIFKICKRPKDFVEARLLDKNLCQEIYLIRMDAVRECKNNGA